MSNYPFQLEVKKSLVAEGNGVFALRSYKRGEVIEVCPAIFLPIKDIDEMKKTKMLYYLFEYTSREFAIVLGYGSIYNHSYKPNAQYRFNFRKRVMVVRALKKIRVGEEIFFNYNFWANDKTPLDEWFKAGVDSSHL